MVMCRSISRQFGWRGLVWIYRENGAASIACHLRCGRVEILVDLTTDKATDCRQDCDASAQQRYQGEQRVLTESSVIISEYLRFP